VADPVVSLARYQAKLGHRVWLGCVPGRSFERRAREAGVKVLEGLHLNRRLNPFHIRSDSHILRRFLEEKQIDVLHTHLINDHWYGWYLQKKRSQPMLLVRTCHRDRTPKTDFFHRRLFKKHTDLLITPSESLKRRLIEKLSISEDRVRTIYGAVDAEVFRPDNNGSAIREEFGIPPSAPVAGIVARLQPTRGHLWLMDAVPQAFAKVPDLHLIIVGRGEIKKKLRAMIAEHPLRDRLHMAGYRKEDQLPQAYAGFDFALFLGQGSEGSCRAILEAMATGMPVIGIRDGVLPETIEDGQTGYLVDAGDTEALSDRIEKMARDREATKAMGRQAREVVLERFQEETRAEQTLGAYGKIWNQKHGNVSL